MRKVLGILAAILLVAVVTTGTFLYFYLNGFSQKKGGDNNDIVQPKEAKNGEPFNILLMGVDVGTVGSKGSPKRSDTMMLFHYNPKTADVAMISIPRDTKVTINGKTEKINAANAYGGPDLAIKTVENLLNVKINYYLEINYEGFRKIIDAIGGIYTVIPYNMNYDDDAQNLHIHFKKGQKVHLDGKKAEEFVRWRKNNDDTGFADGDLGRIKAQQEFMLKVLEKLKSPSILLKIPAIAKLLPEYIDTNMDPFTMASISKDVPRIDINSIQKFTLQGDTKIINELSYIIYEPEKNQDMRGLLEGKIIQPQNSKFDKSRVHVQVLNGSNINGAAGKIADKLKSMGYTITGVGTISGVEFASSHIIDKTLKGDNAKQVAFELDIKHIQKEEDTLSTSDVVVILGLDINKMLE